MQEDITHNPLTPEQREIENALTTFRPAATQINRDALMYAAGHAAGLREIQRQVWPWRIAASFLICSTATLALWHPTRIQYVDHPTIAIVQAPAPQQTDAAMNTSSAGSASTFVPVSNDADAYLQMRQRVLLLGVNALPSLGTGASSAPEASPNNPDSIRAWQHNTLVPSAGDHS